MTDASLIALDTSVIVAGLLGWHERHAPALTVLQHALRHGSVMVPLPALVESYAVMTRLPAPYRVSATDAHHLLVRTFRGRARVVALDGTDAWALLDDAASSDVAGGATYDAHIVACARKAGAARIATFNVRHFERMNLGNVTLLVPG